MTDDHQHLHTYQLHHATGEELGMDADALRGLPSKPLRLTLIGECFFIRARDPVIKVGDLKVVDFEIDSDQTKINCYLYQTPQEGAPISIDYGQGDRVVLDEPFSINKLNQDASA